MNRSKLSVKAILLASGIGLAAASFVGPRPAAAQSYSDDDSCPAGYVYDPSFGYGCTLPGYAYEPYGYGYSPYYGGYRAAHHELGHGFGRGMGGGFAHGMGGGFAHGMGGGFAHGMGGGMGGGFGHGGGGGHRPHHFGGQLTAAASATNAEAVARPVQGIDRSFNSLTVSADLGLACFRRRASV